MREMTKRLIVLRARIESAENSQENEELQMQQMTEDLQAEISRGNYHHAAQIAANITQKGHLLDSNKKAIDTLKDSFEMMKTADEEAAEEYRCYLFKG